MKSICWVPIVVRLFFFSGGCSGGGGYTLSSAASLLSSAAAQYRDENAETAERMGRLLERTDSLLSSLEWGLQLREAHCWPTLQSLCWWMQNPSSTKHFLAHFLRKWYMCHFGEEYSVELHVAPEPLSDLAIWYQSSQLIQDRIFFYLLLQLMLPSCV